MLIYSQHWLIDWESIKCLTKLWVARRGGGWIWYGHAYVLTFISLDIELVVLQTGLVFWPLFHALMVAIYGVLTTEYTWPGKISCQIQHLVRVYELIFLHYSIWDTFNKENVPDRQGMIIRHFRKISNQISVHAHGVLAPGSAHARTSARPSISMSGNFSAHMSAESPSNISPIC